MRGKRTMCSCDFAPHHPDLRSSDLLVRTIDEGNFLAKVESV